MADINDMSIETGLSFEMALSQLEKIVAELESGQAPLEASLELYQKGAKLKAFCEQRLEAARLQVEKISLKAQNPQDGQTEPKVEGLMPASFD
jgi:exodeoxyribonuclease VII small subunit